jgi:NADPH:quinone reductase-like Zn-dependent oxidoreductase
VEQARRVGADLAVDSTRTDWLAEVRSAGGADVVLDMVGADFFAANVELLKPDGHLVVIATMSGHKVDVDLRLLMMKRLTLTASTLRARDADEKARLARAVETQVWPWLEAGHVQPIIDRTFPLERAAEAHQWLEQGAQFGKVVLTFD